MTGISTTDHLRVDPINLTGSDALICQAARVSTLGIETIGSQETLGLIDYLLRSRHGSPFEHGSVTFMVQAPIFVAREHMRHRIGWSYNETSGRYKELDPLFWLPNAVRPLVQVGKAGEYSFQHGTPEQHGVVVDAFLTTYTVAWQQYQTMLHAGVAKEVARAVLPLGTMTSYYATANPRSLMAFLSLRTKDENSTFPSYPQMEIEQVARRMEQIFAARWPLTYKSFVKNGRVAP